MTKRYTGGVISSSLPTVNAAGASGVFLLSQQADYQSRNSWPPFKVEESLRFRRSVPAYLNRTPASASNRKTFTWSGWVKLGSLGVTRQIFGAGSGATQSALVFEAGDTLFAFSANASQTFLRTTQVFRDPSAWYHVVWAEDTTQATSSNRSKLYINGVQITAFSTANYPSQNFDGSINNNAIHYISTYDGSTWAHDGYMAEVNFVDGLQLTPSSFGAADKDGNWSPIAYTGTYGTNGFYLNFRDNTSATTMGYDYSGNSNHWTLSGFNVSTANTTYDIMIDVPEDQSDGTANNRGNYATLNPLDPKNGTQSNANLTHAMGSNDYAAARSTIGMRGDKWYWEATCQTTLQSNFYMGIGITADGDYSGYSYIGSTSGGYSYDGRATKLNNNSSTSYGATYTLNDIIGVALNLDTGTIEFYKNGASQGVAFTGIDTTRTYYAAHWLYTTQISYNFGQRPFAYNPPSGFKSLNTYNLSEPTIKQPSQYMNATLWSGNNTSNREIITGGRSDFVWIKRRDSATSHILFDAIRGAGKTLYSHLTSAEVDNGGYYVQTFGTTSFTLGTGGDAADNITGGTYVGWSWNAGGSTVTNTSGSISAQVRANPTAGFSIVTWTGNLTSGATVGHGLGAVPSMVIVKNRSAGSTNWCVYHISVGNTKADLLNRTDGPFTNTNYWNNTTPTSTAFYLGNGTDTNGSGNSMVAYCFAPIAGYSAFGSYTGNGSTDGTFVYLGFRPKFVMFRRTDTTGYAWSIYDTSRNTYNPETLNLNANASDAETNTGSNGFDGLSNGFKIRDTSLFWNASGGTYIYMAFAEAPFKYARSR